MNWGGRGQSIAIYQLLQHSFEISSVIAGATVTYTGATKGYVDTWLPLKYFSILHGVRKKIKLVDWYLKIEERFGARDFITDDPAKSADYLFRYKSKNPALDEIYRQIINAELVVINGEGSGIFRTPFRRDFFFYLMIIELAARLNKPVFYVNGIISDCPFTGRNSKNFNSARNTLSKCRAVLVRDPESLDYLTKEMPEVRCEYIPDALFSWFPMYERFGACVPLNGDFIIPPPENNEYFGKLDFSKPYICIGGSSWAAEFQEQAVSHYLQLLQGIRELGYAVYLTQNCGGDRFLQEVARESACGLIPWNTPIMMAGAILANARLFISGRFHPTIFASLGGTPCVFLEAHSHKMASLQKTLEYVNPKQFSAMPENRDIAQIASLAEQHIHESPRLREKIKAVVTKRCDEARQLPQRILDYL